MGTFITYTKRSYSANEKERNIIEFLLKYFEQKMNMPFKPSETFDDINVMWSPAMLEDDNGIFGMWHWLLYSDIYIVPERKTKLNSSAVLYRYLNIDTELANSALYLIDYEGMIMSSIFHELWHRKQFTDNPMKYILSFMLFAFVPYETSCKAKWSIEYDVRQKVDTEELRQAIITFSKKVKDYLYFSNALCAPTSDDDLKQYAFEVIDNTDQGIKDFCSLFFKKD